MHVTTPWNFTPLARSMTWSWPLARNEPFGDGRVAVFWALKAMVSPGPFAPSKMSCPPPVDRHRHSSRNQRERRTHVEEDSRLRNICPAR
ncbi:MAG: hypothetical protein AVDCRST_MAG30-133 [uncultured Solirubrobacteraceae bacterium]|uniref:Uncharacterized protein n=1 Tax=uncultured Solirubrobacteraceae bacterium TaxID=1162706 RepID=A0A6J4RFJ1_9ACTN|nr:MAG: hypothetical protein AVDCRST_MAG30-133 [uncultured Solirubrobacteraceae bacterium]